ncbi:ribonuclease P protein component [Candidatus Ichthyocystis hellenicum]|uniref:ribonuclease P protein component n=1 Tax=Candidatus Ichthyocystis hellenicum TaxID=1561003 RepID=UPI000B82176D|nr:ribonuclease P protein component [Candidatus Ichthyocystis hellenicum]
MTVDNSLIKPRKSSPLPFKRSSYSIRKKSEFALVYSSKPVSVRSGPFKAYCYKGTGQPFVRIGMVIPKKATVTSVRRNLVKRLIRECFRTRICHLPAADIVVALKGNVSSITRHDIRNYVEQLFSLLSEGE